MPAGLELGLDQRNHIAAGPQPPGDNRQDESQGNERHVDRNDVERLRQRFQRADIGPFHDNDAPILPQPPVQDPLSNVDGVHLLRAMLQQTIREATRGSSDIGADLAFDSQAVGFERRLELESATRDKTRWSDDLQPGGLRHHLRRLDRRLAIDPDFAGQDEAPSARSALGQAPPHQRLVEALPAAPRGWPLRFFLVRRGSHQFGMTLAARSRRNPGIGMERRPSRDAIVFVSSQVPF
jgi:hypothetical protein